MQLHTVHSSALNSSPSDGTRNLVYIKAFYPRSHVYLLEERYNISLLSLHCNETLPSQIHSLEISDILNVDMVQYNMALTINLIVRNMIYLTNELH